MSYWRKHQKKELELLLQKFDDAGWTIEDPLKYYSVKCPCGDHRRWIHLTPSGNNYAKDALGWLERQPCHPSKRKEQS
ncbi:hypothetical protein EH165_12765 [Nakamurella antarctica]|uniref:Uncharacterized protein n=1 Tax=Nakamurella antarctica TaxID=1902245 RepID=A0A3G8ZZA5_9ACTN|nr:hypothetical protein EH165_12765 [Nakamurella antarctica]